MTLTTLTAANVRSSAWQRIGRPALQGESVNDAMDAAGLLGWDLITRPLVSAGHDDQPLHVPQGQAVIRRTPEGSRSIAAVGPAYEVVQNEAIGAIAQAVVDASDGAARVYACGPYRQDRQVFVTVNIPGVLRVGGEDMHDLNVAILGSHDGSLAVTPMVTPVRLACMNSQRIAKESAVSIQRVRHTATAGVRMAAAQAALEQVLTVGRGYVAEMDRLLAMDTSANDVEALLTAIFPVAPGATAVAERRAVEAREQTRLLAASGETTAFGRGTRYGLFQAATEYLEWVRPSDTSKAAGTLLLGSGATVHSRLRRVLTTYSVN